MTIARRCKRQTAGHPLENRTRLRQPKFIASRGKPSENKIDNRKTLFLADEVDRGEGVVNFPLDSLVQKQYELNETLSVACRRVGYVSALSQTRCLAYIHQRGHRYICLHMSTNMCGTEALYVHARASLSSLSEILHC
jgi:hypothetical protein